MNRLGAVVACAFIFGAGAVFIGQVIHTGGLLPAIAVLVTGYALRYTWKSMTRGDMSPDSDGILARTHESAEASPQANTSLQFPVGENLATQQPTTTSDDIAQRHALVNESDTYDVVGRELESGTIDRGTWTKAFADADGDEARTKAAYIRIRVAALQSQFRHIKSQARTDHEEMEGSRIAGANARQPSVAAKVSEANADRRHVPAANTTKEFARSVWLVGLISLFVIGAIFLTTRNGSPPGVPNSVAPASPTSSNNTVVAPTPPVVMANRTLGVGQTNAPVTPAKVLSVAEVEIPDPVRSPEAFAAYSRKLLANVNTPEEIAAWNQKMISQMYAAQPSSAHPTAALPDPMNMPGGMPNYFNAPGISNSTAPVQPPMTASPAAAAVDDYIARQNALIQKLLENR